MSEDNRFSVEVATAAEGWVTDDRCETMAEAESKVLKQGGGPQGHSPHPGKGEGTMSIDWDRPVQTRDGRKVTIYTTKGSHTVRPVIGEVHGATNLCVPILSRWLHDGSDSELIGESDDDLINVPQQHTVWVNVNGEREGAFWLTSHSTSAEANHAVVPARIACFEHTFTEGEGL